MCPLYSLIMKRNIFNSLYKVQLTILFLQCIISCESDNHSLLDQKPLRRDSSGRIIVERKPDPRPRSTNEALNSIYVPKGYHLELVAAEPMVREPVSITWDANGRMYVAEMLTYMQDIDAVNEDKPLSRISLLEDTNGDGKMDKNSIYIDSLVLPRMILCVGNRLLVSETFTNDIWEYSDLTNDGKADHRKKVFGDHTPHKANLEHQRSGFIWNIDNCIYVTRENVCYRYVDGKLETDTLTGENGQWGLGNDDYGRLFYTTAGSEHPGSGFQLNPHYAAWFSDKDEVDGEFRKVWPIVATPDVQGGPEKLRADSTLSVFTSCCGQSIYRGDALPADLRGDYIICEPVGRLIRRAKVINRDGLLVLKNAYTQEEFISSTDMNFRPVNTATGPDGNLYIVDMYRGIIQEGRWTGPGSYLRKEILKRGLDKNVGRGRIYRLVYNGFKQGPKPKMLQESSNKLVNYLSHTNGWWRDNAQKEIILRNDRTVVTDLKGILRRSSNHLARLHALWTLNGLGVMEKEILAIVLEDSHAELRKAAIRVSEPYLKKQDAEVNKLVLKLIDDKDIGVQTQLVASLIYSNNETNEWPALRELNKRCRNQEWINAVTKELFNAKKQKLYGYQLAGLTDEQRIVALKGREIFNQTCAVCHGRDGEGTSTDWSTLPAPRLVSSNRAKNKSQLINILLHGLTGPIDKRTYNGEMLPMGAGNTDEWIATVLAFVHALGTQGENGYSAVTAKEVRKIRQETASRKKKWTIEELEQKYK
jgi:glucose/arabinose dehydrogenase/mono/diheme cytochrome c family protein